MEWFAICLCVVAFGEVSAVSEPANLSKENPMVATRSVGASSIPRAPSTNDRMGIHPRKAISGEKDHNGYSSDKVLFHSETSESSDERVEIWGSHHKVLNLRKVRESSHTTTRRWPKIYLRRADRILNIQGRKMSTDYLRPVRGVVDSRGTVSVDTPPEKRKRKGDIREPTTSDRSDGKRSVRSRRHGPPPPLSTGIPKKLAEAMKVTDYWEDQLLLQFVTEHNRTTIGEITDDYNEAQHEERWLLKRLLEGLPDEAQAEQLLNNYRALRTGRASKDKESVDVYAGFFHTPSDLLTEYKDVKDNELEVDGYLDGTLQYSNEAELDKEMSGRAEFADLPAPVRRAADVKRLARLHSEEAALLPKVETPSMPSSTQPNTTVTAESVTAPTKGAPLFSASSAADTIASLTASPVTIPVAGPIASPFASSAGSPVSSPVSNPVASSVASPLGSPVVSTGPVEAANPTPASSRAQLSFSVFKCLLGKLPDVLRRRMADTDEAESVVLGHYAQVATVPDDAVATYSERQKAERELLKQVLAEAGLYAPQFLELYKTVRTGRAWNYLKLDGAFREFFQHPSDALTEYETLKREELASLDAFLLEPVQRNATGPTQNGAERSEDELARGQKAEAAAEDDEELGRAESWGETGKEKDEMGEQMEERKVRAKDADSFGNKSVPSMETVTNFEVATHDANGTDEVLRSPDDNVTSGVRATTMFTANQKAKRTFRVVRIGLILSVPINVILAVAILGLYRNDIMEWYRQRKIWKAAQLEGERELLYSRKAVSTV